MSENAAGFVGSVPKYYDEGLGPRIFVPFARDLAARIAELGPSSVLELAAGTGIVTRQLRDVLPAGCELLATDLNGPMLEVARAKFEPSERVAFETADAMRLPYADHSFDVLTSQFGIMFFPDQVESFAQALRVLKPGGSYLFNVWDSWAHNPFGQVTHETVAKFFPDDPPQFYRVPFSCADADAVRAKLLEAGFTQIDVHTVSLRSAISSAREFAEGLILGNPLFDEILGRNGDPEMICVAMADAVAAQLGDDMQIQAIVFCATA